jgi:hypothetical protein
MPRAKKPATKKKNPPHLFQPGQSGNPAGRPGPVAKLRKYVEEHGHYKGMSFREAYVKAAFKNPEIMKHLANRLYPAIRPVEIKSKTLVEVAGVVAHQVLPRPIEDITEQILIDIVDEKDPDAD